VDSARKAQNKEVSVFGSIERRRRSELVLLIAAGTLFLLLMLVFPLATPADTQPSLSCTSGSTSDGVSRDCKAAVSVTCYGGGTCRGIANVVVTCQNCGDGAKAKLRALLSTAAWFRPDMKCGANCSEGAPQGKTTYVTTQVPVTTLQKKQTGTTSSCKIGGFPPHMVCTAVAVYSMVPVTTYLTQVKQQTIYTCGAQYTVGLGPVPDINGQPSYSVSVALAVTCPNSGGNASASVEANKTVLAAQGFSTG
jgi:hypothetical protein